MKIINIYISFLKFIRVTQITWVVFKASVRELFTFNRVRRGRKVHKHVYTTPERIRLTIEELGPTFVKFGQILADRPDMVSERFRVELKKLQSKAKPFDNKVAFPMIEKQLRAPIAEVFESFDPIPLAAASIGQVYQGQLKNGEHVIVKIQRPFIENKIKLDIYLLKYMAARFARNYPELAAVNIVGLVDEFSASIVHELDYTIELSNIVRFQGMFRQNPGIHIPKVYPKYCSKHLIVMEQIFGITPEDGDCLRRQGFDPHVIALNGTHALLTMVLQHGFFHADPHAGNILIMEDNVIGFIDFGMVAFLTPCEMNFLADFVLGSASRDSVMISKAILVLCGKKFFEKEDELKFDVHQMIMKYSDLPFETVHFSQTMQDCIDIVIKYRLQIPTGIFMLIKSLSTIEKFASRLEPGISLGPIILPYAKEVVKKKFSVRKIASEIYDAILNYAIFVRDLPKDLSEILYKLKEGKIKHEIQISDEALILKVIRQFSIRISYTFLLVGVFIGGIIMIVMNVESRYGHFIMAVASLLILLQLLKWFFSNKE